MRKFGNTKSSKLWAQGGVVLKMAAPMDEHATNDISSKTSEKDDKTDVDQSNITKRSWKDKRIHTNCIERADFACKHSKFRFWNQISSLL